MPPYSIKPVKKAQKPLSDLHILLTRAGNDNDALAKKLRALGAVVLIFPCLQIEIFPPARLLENPLHLIEQSDAIVFTSRYAVRSIQKNWPKNLPTARYYAIGPATAAEMEAIKLPTAITAEPYSSEGLLNHPSLEKITAETWVILGGENPREHLQINLERRGAQVNHIACYRRKCPNYSNQSIARLEKEAIHQIVVQSMDCLKNLAQLLKPMPMHSLWATDLLLPTERYVALATALGFYGRLRVAGSAADEAILATLGT